jgi:hypothetical protein
MGVMLFWIASFSISYTLVKSTLKPYVALSFLVSAVAAPMVSAHMFLTESFVAATMMTLFWTGYNTALSQATNTHYLLLVGIAGFLIVFAAPVYIFSLALFVVYLIKTRVISFKVLLAFKNKLVLMIAAYASIPVLLSFQGALNAFRYDYFEFNSNIYFPMRLMQRDESAMFSLVTTPWLNAFSFLIQIYTAANNLFHTLLTTTKQFVLGLSIIEAISWINVGFTSFFQSIRSMEILMMLAVTSCAFLLLVNRKYSLAFLLAISLLYLSVRNTNLFHLSSFFFGTIVFVCITLHEISLASRTRLLIIPGFLLASMLIASVPNYQMTVAQRQASYYPMTLETASFLRDKSLQTSTIQNLRPDVGLFHVVPTIKSSTSLYYYYPWIHAAEPLRAEVIRALTKGDASLIYAPEDISYAPEITTLVSKNYVQISESLYAKK